MCGTFVKGRALGATFVSTVLLFVGIKRGFWGGGVLRLMIISIGDTGVGDTTEYKKWEILVWEGGNSFVLVVGGTFVRMVVVVSTSLLLYFSTSFFIFIFLYPFHSIYLHLLPLLLLHYILSSSYSHFFNSTFPS